MSDRVVLDDNGIFAAYAALVAQAVVPIVLGSFASVKVRQRRPQVLSSWQSLRRRFLRRADPALRQVESAAVRRSQVHSRSGR
jgi:hypothetical protein